MESAIAETAMTAMEKPRSPHPKKIVRSKFFCQSVPKDAKDYISYNMSSKYIETRMKKNEN